MNFSCARNFAVVALVSFALTGCFDETKETGPVHDVEWFKTHNNERQATLEECANNPGELKDTPNCSNALEAEKQLSSGSLHDVNNW
jgi:hypothetical protein